MICVAMGMGPMNGGTLGLFMLPFQNEFGWSRTDVMISSTIVSVTVMTSFSFLGRLVDFVGASRPIILFSMFALAAMFAAIPTFVSQLWHLHLAMVLIGTLAMGTNSLPYLRLLSKWFNRQLGLAFGITMAGIGIGYTVAPLLVQFMIDNFSWRAGYYALSSALLFIGIPLVAMIVKESPAAMGLEVDGAVSSSTLTGAVSKDVGLTVAEATRTRIFWILLSSAFLLSFSLYGTHAHIVPMLSDRGMSGSSAASVAAAMGFSMFIGRIGSGYLLDKFFAPPVAVVAFSLSVVGTLILLLGGTNTMAFVAAIMIGVAMGTEGDVIMYLTNRYFGLRAFGTLSGFCWTAILAGIASSPILYAIDFDTSGNYSRILTIGLSFNIVALILMATLRQRYPNWKEATQ
jgi:MFS family permease